MGRSVPENRYFNSRKNRPRKPVPESRHFLAFMNAPIRELTKSSVLPDPEPACDPEPEPEADPENREVIISSGFLEPSNREEMSSEVVCDSPLRRLMTDFFFSESASR